MAGSASRLALAPCLLTTRATVASMDSTGLPVPPGAQGRRWVTYDDVADVLRRPLLKALAEDLTGVDQCLRDPFEYTDGSGDAAG